MNNALQKFMSKFYRISIQPGIDDRGSSSLIGTQKLRDDILKLLEKYNIRSIFDGGCNDCKWASSLAQYIDYQGGDIAPGLIAEAWHWYPYLNINIHDVTTDPFPPVELVMIRDVAIHLNNQDKQRVIKNWLDSNIPFLLTTHNIDQEQNTDFDYADEFPVSPVNWCLMPWNFPQPRDYITETVDQAENKAAGRVLALWHRDDIKGLI
jgi:hypothetical protein